MELPILQEIGLTKAEVQVYTSLLALGSTKAGPIIEQTMLQSSVVYATLKRLIEKGFVTFVAKGNARHYQAVRPQYILKYFDQKRSQIEDLIPTLEANQRKYEEQTARVLEGFDAFKIIQYEFIEGTKAGDEYLFFAFFPPNPKRFAFFYNYFNEFEAYRRKIGLEVKGIAPESLRPLLQERDQKGMLYVDFPIPTNIAIVQNKVLQFPWTEQKQMSFLITSAQLAESYRSFFYSIWDKYKK